MLGLTVIFDMDSVGMHVLWKPGMWPFHIANILQINQYLIFFLLHLLWISTLV